MHDQQYDPTLDLVRRPWVSRGHLVVPAGRDIRSERDYVRAYVCYSELFGQRPSIEELITKVRSIRLGSIMMLLATMAIVLENEGVSNHDVQHWLREELVPLEVRQRIAGLDNAENRIIFFPQQILTVMKLALLNSPDGLETRRRDEWVPDLVESLFIASDLVNEDTVRAVEGSTDPTIIEPAIVQFMLRNFFLNSSEHLSRMLPRYSILFLQIPRREELVRSANVVDLERAFLEATGFDLTIFFALTFGIIAQFMEQNISQGIDHNRTHIRRSSYFSRAAIEQSMGHQMLDYLSISPNEIRGLLETRGVNGSSFYYDFLCMMQCPLYRVEEDVLVPFDFGFLKEKVTGGIYWIIVDSLTGEDKLRFMRFFGEVFQTYVSELFERSFPESLALAKRLYHEFPYRTPFGDRRTCDEIILYGEEAIFAEVTASRIKMVETAIAGDLGAFEEDLEKIVFQKAGQLNRTIEDFRKGLFTLNGVTSETVRRIYPVIITIQSFPQTTLVWRRIERGLRERRFLQAQGVERIQMVDIDELEIVEPALQRGSSLMELLQEKAADVEYRNITFKNFLYDRHSNLLGFSNEYLGREREQFFDESVRFFFPGAVTTDA